MKKSIIILNILILVNHLVLISFFSETDHFHKNHKNHFHIHTNHVCKDDIIKPIIIFKLFVQYINWFSIPKNVLITKDSFTLSVWNPPKEFVCI